MAIDPITGYTVDDDRGGADVGQVQTRPARAPAGPPPDDSGLWVIDRDTGQWELPTANQGAHDLWKKQQEINAAAERAAPPTTDTFKEGGFDDALLDPFRADRQAALGDQRRVLEFALGLEGPQQLTPEERQALEQRFAERATLAANTVAANARGGAGAVAAARMGVNQQMPQVAGEANLQAQQVAQSEFQNRVAAFNARVGQAQTAGGVASTIGQTAIGAFGQESAQQGQVRQMITDVEGLKLDYTKIDIDTQLRIFEGMIKKYGIDEQTAAQIKAAAIANEKGVMDYIAQGADILSSIAAPIPVLVKTFGGESAAPRPLDSSNPYG